MGKLVKRVNLYLLAEVGILVMMAFIFSGTYALTSDEVKIVDGVPNCAYRIVQGVIHLCFAYGFFFAAAALYADGDIVPLVVIYAIEALLITQLAEDSWIIEIFSAPLFVFAGVAFVAALLARLSKKV